MPAPRRNPVPPNAADRPQGHGISAGLNYIDLREIATGAFVVVMALLGSKWSPRWFAHASDIVLTQVFFELPMALLAVCAGKAISQPTDGRRGATVCLGMLLVATAGIHTAFEVGAPSAIAGGVWLILARAAPPRGLAWFSAEHCRAIEVTAGTAWACLIAGLSLLWLLSAITSPHSPGQAAPGFVYATAWGGYYLALALVLPKVRRRFGARGIGTRKR